MIKTYKFKLYKTKRLKHLHRSVNLAAEIYNHCIALHKRYYRLYDKTLNIYVLQSHITKLKNLSKYSYWNNLNSQAIQEITERIDNGYQKFFRHENKRPPTFKKIKKYRSFKLKTSGYKFKDNTLFITHKRKANDKHFKFHLSREIEGNIKTLTVKRDSLGDFYIFITVCIENVNPTLATSGKSVGMDFGLKTFLTLSDGNKIESPLYFLNSLNKVRKLSRKLSTKKKGSNNRKKARIDLARLHKKIENQRDDFFFKTANYLAKEYGYVFIEDLNIKAMQRLWGRKVSDVAYGKFIKILSYKTNIGKIDRFYPSSKTCSDCGYVYQELSLKERYWYCPKCGTLHDRDINAAININRVGASTLAGVLVRPAMPARNVDSRISCL